MQICSAGSVLCDRETSSFWLMLVRFGFFSSWTGISHHPADGFEEFRQKEPPRRGSSPSETVGQGGLEIAKDE